MKRKQENLKIERQKKAQRRFHMSVGLAICLAVAAAISWFVWDAQNRRWLMTFENTRIETADLRFLTDAFFAMGLERDEAKELAMEELMNTVAILNRAEMHDAQASPEEMAELLPEAQMQIDWLNANFISVNRVAELFSAGASVTERLMDLYAPPRTPDPVEFAEALAEYAEDNAWTMNFGGEEFHHELRFLAESYMMVLDEEMSRQIAIDELSRNLAVLQRGEMHDVLQTPEQLEEWIEQAEMQRQWMGDLEISSLRMAEIWTVEDVQQRLMEIYIPPYDPDPAELEDMIADYVEENRDNYTLRLFQYAAVESPTEAMHIFDQGQNANFEELIWAYCIMQNEEFGYELMQLHEAVSNLGLDFDDEEILRNMNQGDLHIVQADDLFIVLYLLERTEATDEAMADSFLADFANNIRRMEFDALLQEWVEENNPHVTADEAGFEEFFIQSRRFEEFTEIVQGWIDDAAPEINQRAYAAV